MDHRRIALAVLLAGVMVIGVYGAIGQTLEGTHGIVGKGEVSCLKCHYGKYEEMVSTGHGQDFVDNIAELYYNSGSEPDPIASRDEARAFMEENAETYACLMCHMKRDRFGYFGMRDLVVWKENGPTYNYPDELWALGAGIEPFPYGPGYTGTTAGTPSNTSDVTLYINGTTSATQINATFTFFDANGDNTDTTITLTQSGSDFYGGVSNLYPDYFQVVVVSDAAETAPDMYIISDGEYVGVYDDNLAANTPRTLRGTRIYTPGGDPSATYVRNAAYVYNWNFHTGDYGVITKMTEVWDQIRTYNITAFPKRGNPIDYLGIVGDGYSCSSTRGLCHSVLSILDQVENERAIRNTIVASGYEYYYKHTMTLSTASEEICGTCHAPLFADGYSAHEGVQCYDCHAGHPMPAGAE